MDVNALALSRDDESPATCELHGRFIEHGSAEHDAADAGHRGVEAKSIPHASVLVSGLHWIMPNGRVAPGKVLPPPSVPMIGSTESYGEEAFCAEEENPEVKESKMQMERNADRTRIERSLDSKIIRMNSQGGILLSESWDASM